MIRMVTPEAIQKWQGIWSQLLDMTYLQKNIKSTIFIQDSESEMLDLYVWKRNDPDFYKLTFDHAWTKYSQLRDESGKYIEPEVVPELTYLYVSGTLFHDQGVGAFMRKCFPNCVVTYWED